MATFGFLEETLGKAIFAFSGTRPYSEAEIEEAYRKWLPTLKRALSDQLGNLITSFEREVKAHPSATISNLADLVQDLRAAAKLRNVICHGSWRSPDLEQKSIPLYVNFKGEVFDIAVDVQWLDQLQQHTAELVCAVVNTVTHMGWQFPGSSGPGRPIHVPANS